MCGCVIYFQHVDVLHLYCSASQSLATQQHFDSKHLLCICVTIEEIQGLIPLDDVTPKRKNRAD